MSMTGKYAVDDDPVIVSADIEAAITERFESGMSYDSAKDVEFHCFVDGLCIDTPITGGSSSRFPLNVTIRALAREGRQWLVDLKAIYDGKTASADKRMKKYTEIQALP